MHFGKGPTGLCGNKYRYYIIVAINAFQSDYTCNQWSLLITCGCEVYIIEHAICEKIYSQAYLHYICNILLGFWQYGTGGDIHNGDVT